MPESGTLAAALVELQAALPHVTKDAENPHFKSRYASLAALTDALLPVMAKLGLAWVCSPTIDEAMGLVLFYKLIHAPSGGELAGYYPLPASAGPQQIGSAITYARRYALCAITGLVADEDDDGNAAEAGPKNEGPARQPRTGSNASLAAQGRMTRGQKAAHEQLAADTVANPKLADRGITGEIDQWDTGAPENRPGSAAPEQLRSLAIALNKIGITGDDRLVTCASMADRDITSSKELSYTEAAKILAWAQAEYEQDPKHDAESEATA